MRRYRFLQKDEIFEALNRLRDAFLAAKNGKEVEEIINGLLTYDEKMKIGRRILIATLVKDGVVFDEIAKTLKVGKNTIASVIRNLDQYPLSYELIEKRRQKVEALRGTTKAFDKRIHKLKPHKGQLIVAQRLRSMLAGSSMVDNTKTQDQYSIRCIPQIHGAIRDAISYAENVINTEINAVTDNPLIFANNDGSIDVLSGGNFHGEPIAIALDTLGIVVSELANVSDRRIASLLDPATNNGLPAFLMQSGGVNSGMMRLQYTTAALVSENKILAHPASVDSIPTSANVEDFVSMGTISARKALEIAKNVKHVLAIELLVASQAINFRLENNLKLGNMTQKVYNAIRKVVLFLTKYTIYYPFITQLEYNIDQDKFVI